MMAKEKPLNHLLDSFIIYPQPIQAVGINGPPDWLIDRQIHKLQRKHG